MDIQVERVQEAVLSACHKAGREQSEVTVIAVTKYVDKDMTQALIKAGYHHLGENRVDKFLDKKKHLPHEGLVWHFIGSLQRRKVKDVIDHIDYFHALDSLSLAQEIQKRASRAIKCFLQVNVSGETSKHGFSPQELTDDLLEELAKLDRVEIVGLMTMAPYQADEDVLTHVFSQTRKIQQQLQEKAIRNMPMTELSMGMSGDFPLAIQEGASFVRIGSLFFD